MPLVMANKRDADAIGDFAIKKMIREAPQISPTEFGTDRMKSSGIGGGKSDQVAQLLLEFVAKDW